MKPAIISIIRKVNNSKYQRGCRRQITGGNINCWWCVYGVEVPCSFQYS